VLLLLLNQPAAAGSATANGATLTATASLIAGTANGGALAAGVTLTAPSSLSRRALRLPPPPA
jgi:hypothetical protein